MTEHIHTDECWDPDSGCDMGRNEEFARVASPDETKRIDAALDAMADLMSEALRVPAYIRHPDTRYNKTYDGYYNVHTREWLEKKCGDDDCEFCARRPDLAPMEE